MLIILLGYSVDIFCFARHWAKELSIATLSFWGRVGGQFSLTAWAFGRGRAFHPTNLGKVRGQFSITACFGDELDERVIYHSLLF